MSQILNNKAEAKIVEKNCRKKYKVETSTRFGVRGIGDQLWKMSENLSDSKGSGPDPKFLIINLSIQVSRIFPDICQGNGQPAEYPAFP